VSGGQSLADTSATLTIGGLIVGQLEPRSIDDNRWPVCADV